MYPVLLRIGSFEISSFGALVALGAIVGLVILRRELTRIGLDAGRGQQAALIALIAGLVGAKVLFVIEHWEDPLSETLLARGGLSWFGGLIGGLGAGVIAVRREKLALLATFAAAAPAVAVGQAIGRIGCFLVGDDYGTPSPLPWAVAFPRGLPPTDVPVHPTQLYEAFGLIVVAGLLIRWRRHGCEDVVVVARYLLLAGGLRFAVEFVRVNARVIAGLSVAHAISAIAMLAGVVLIALRARGDSSRPAGPHRPATVTAP